MRQFHARALVLVALAIPLGACNSFLGIKFARHAPKDTPVQVAENASETASATAAGRDQLAAGQTGLAIESFQRALGAGEPVAPAINGMGVAYARLGRYDLARRFFEQAMASDPANARYADNLARLMRSPLLAMRRDADIAAAAVKVAQLAPTPATLGAAVPAPGRLQRLSRAEVRIVTVPTQTAPSRNASKSVDGRFKPLIRVTFADKQEIAKQGFVRIELPEPRVAGAPSATESVVRQ